MRSTIIHHFRHLLLLLALCVLPWGAAVGRAAEENQPEGTVHAAMEAAIAAVKPALVKIHVVTVDYAEGREVKEEAFGSGVIIDKAGYVITNHHVAGNATYFTCTLADKQEFEATLIGTDALTDIAIIKLKTDAPRDFPFAKFGDSNAMRVGDRVFAMGSPLAFSQSVTMGVVSNTELVLPETFSEALTLDGEDVGSVVRWIGHDAVIYGGNSGGPLVNINGEIIGINEVDLGLSGAIPGNLAWQTAQQLMQHGKVQRSWVGLSVQPLLKSAVLKQGVLITGALGDSPAAKAGFLAGDTLLKLDGRPIEVRYKEQLPLFNQMVMELPVGKEIAAVVERDGKELTLHVTPAPRPETQAKTSEMKSWGMCASNITLLDSKAKQLASSAGVLVHSVTSGGPAGSAKPALEEEDVIQEVDGKPVNSLDDLQKLTEALTAGKDEPAPVTVAFQRHDEHYLTVVKVGLQELHDPGQEVRKAWLPIGMQVLTEELAKALNLEGRTGVRVTQVYPNSAAEKAGLQVGDIIVAVDDTAIEASQPEDVEVLPTMIRQYKIGSTVALTVFRKGQKSTLKVKLPESPRQFQELKKYADANYDFSVRDISFRDRVQEHWSETQPGVVTESVNDGGWAALGGLSAGDLITAIDGQPVTNVDGMEALMKKLAAGKPHTIVVQVKRSVFTAFLELQANWSQSVK